MSELLDQCTEVLRQRNDLSKFFRRNACARHGVPWDEKEQPLEIQHDHKHTHESVPVATESLVKDVAEQLKGDESFKGPPGETPVVDEGRIVNQLTEKIKADPDMRGPRGERGDEGPRGDRGPAGNGQSNGDRKIPKWLLPAVVGAGLVGGPALAWYLSSGSGGSNTNISSPTDPADRTGSLLQHLEDQGRHLPGGD